LFKKGGGVRHCLMTRG